MTLAHQSESVTASNILRTCHTSLEPSVPPAYLSQVAHLDRVFEAQEKVFKEHQARHVAEIATCHNAAVVAIVTEHKVSKRTAYRWVKANRILGGERLHGSDGKSYPARDSAKSSSRQSAIERKLSIALHAIKHARSMALEDGGITEEEWQKLEAVASAAHEMHQNYAE